MIRHKIPFSFLFLSALVFPFVSRAQSTQPAPLPEPNATVNQAAPDAKPKRVWTNEDVKSSGPVSVIGDKRNQHYTMTKPADPATVAKYRADLQKLQSQLTSVKKDLESFAEFEQGKPVSSGARDISHGYKRTPVTQQVAKLLEKRKILEDKIDALYDEARKKGIEAAQLD